MERSEPALVPEWLKTSSGAGSNSKSAPSFLHSDDRGVSKHVRNRSPASISDRDIRHSSFSGQTTSSYFRHGSSSNGSSQLRTHSSLGRNQYDQRYNDYPDSPLPNRLGKDVIRRSRSSLTGRRGDSWPTIVAGDYKNGNKSNHRNSDSLLTGVSVTSVHKSAFEMDFPSLGTEEKKISSEMVRVPSPGLSTAIQSLPVGSSDLIGSDGWTSALVEVRGAIGSNGMNVVPPQQTVSASSPSTLPSVTTVLNMAETVAQSPSRAGTPPSLAIETQRREELVMKQTKQLIPVTPSPAKSQVLNPLEKGKPEIGQQHGSHLANLTSRAQPVKSDVSKSFLGKLQVLKPSGGTSSSAKESFSPASGSRVMNRPLGTPSLPAGSVPFRSLNSNPNTLVGNKPTPKTAEKKPSAQTKSRNDFFKSIKKKSSAPSPSTIACSSHAGSPSALELEKLNEVTTKPDTLPNRDAPSADPSIMDLSSNGTNGCGLSHIVVYKEEKNLSLVTILPPDEEEAALLRLLGWEEGSGEDEGLTEEEINSFYELYPSFRP